MSFHVSILLALLLTLLVLYFSAREVSRFRKGQINRTDLYPYTRSRLIRRSLVSFLILAEIHLLVLGRFSLDPRNPIWFLSFVGLVIGFAVIMVMLALLDLRESKRWEEWGQEKIYQDLLTEIHPPGNPPSNG